MTIRFGNNRLAFYIFIFLLSGTVLGLSANFANQFLPKIHNEFTTFSLVTPSLTIFVFLLMLQWAQPWNEAVAYFILGVLWLTMGAWSTDIIGNVQCDALGGQTTPTKNGSMSSKAYCHEMKVIQAFSWAIFCMFAIGIIILVSLVSRAQMFGRYEIWYEPIRELPWFGEAPGYYNTTGMMPAQMPMGYLPQGYNGYPGGMPMQASQGQTTIIQPGINGAPPTITHV